MKIKMYSKKNICLIPTYSCNANCPFCYAKEFKKKFRKEMDWQMFKKVVDICLNHGKRNEVSFLGGEPTVWRHINQAVSYLKERNVQVNFFTNGINCSAVAPDCVLINIYNSFNNKIRNKIKKSILLYKRQGVEVGLRYNLASGSSTDDERFINFAVPLADYVSISPAIPYSPSEELGSRIFKLVHNFHAQKRIVKISRAIPICLFNSQKFRYLREKCSLRTECYSEKNIVINPDGKTIFPCVNIPIFSLNLFKDGLPKINRVCKKFFKSLSLIRPFPQCQKCQHAADNKCQAGCLGMRPLEVIKQQFEKINL
jgi:MoaA/NifB/PqqE/SkfB family radical SAM enzyme